MQSDDIVVKANIVGQISLPRQLLPQPACCGGARLLFERTVGIPYNICPIHSSYPSDNCQILSGVSSDESRSRNHRDRDFRFVFFFLF